MSGFVVALNKKRDVVLGRAVRVIHHSWRWMSSHAGVSGRLLRPDLVVTGSGGGSFTGTSWLSPPLSSVIGGTAGSTVGSGSVLLFTMVGGLAKVRALCAFVWLGGGDLSCTLARKYVLSCHRHFGR